MQKTLGLKKLAFGAATVCIASSAMALGSGARVDNFRLLDQRGASHELYYLSDMKAVVLVTQANGCAASQGTMPAAQSLSERYKDQGVAVLMLNSNRDARAAVLAETDKAGVSVPVLIDELQLIGESLATTHSGEALVINPKDWTLAYRGALDKASDAVDAVVAGAAVKTAKTPVQGCAVKMPERDRKAAHAAISYSKTIAPLLAEKCVTCHREGGIGPWQMTSYELVRGFAPMIREVLRTERMPPWHADPHYGTFKNYRGLNSDERKTLVHWIEAGAPRGTGSDPLAESKKQWSEWPHGQPDLVLTVPAFTVPATGTIDYQNPRVKNPLDRDVWLSAIDFNPGDRGVVHHILVNTVPANSTGRFGGAYLGGYVPGGAPIVYPEDTGILLTKDQDITFQMHYTAKGKEATDVTRIGLYFRKDPPKYPLRNVVLLDPRIKIPANTKAHTETVSRVFDRDVMVYTLTAHSHFRGIASKFVAQYPDGREETLLSVPRYDFNWQTAYELTTPKVLPKGTKLIYNTTYDNSVQNKANPDPNIVVRWGEQSWEEMLYGNVRFRYMDETVGAIQTSQAQ